MQQYSLTKEALYIQVTPEAHQFNRDIWFRASKMLAVSTAR